MDSFFSFIFFMLLPLALGILTIYFSIDLFEYLKKYPPPAYRDMSFENLFGISNDNNFFHLIRPKEFLQFLLSTADMQDNQVKVHKQRIKLSLFSLIGLFAIYLFWALVS